MNKTVKLGLSSLLTAGALGAALLQAPAASANPGFVCPAGSDTIPARYGTAPDGTPMLRRHGVRVRRHHGVPVAGRDRGLACGGEGRLRFPHDRRHLHQHPDPQQGRGHLQVRPARDQALTRPPPGDEAPPPTPTGAGASRRFRVRQLTVLDRRGRRRRSLALACAAGAPPW